MSVLIIVKRYNGSVRYQGKFIDFVHVEVRDTNRFSRSILQ